MGYNINIPNSIKCPGCCRAKDSLIFEFEIQLTIQDNA